MNTITKEDLKEIYEICNLSELCEYYECHDDDYYEWDFESYFNVHDVYEETFPDDDFNMKPYYDYSNNIKFKKFDKLFKFLPESISKIIYDYSNIYCIIDIDSDSE